LMAESVLVIHSIIIARKSVKKLHYVIAET
jgi:hypothetical protein